MTISKVFLFDLKFVIFVESVNDIFKRKVKKKKKKESRRRRLIVKIMWLCMINDFFLKY